MVSSDASFVPVAYGVDDVTLGFDMEGSGDRAIERSTWNADTAGENARRGCLLGEVVTPLGRSAAFWKSDTNRLYVQAKFAPEGELCLPASLGAEIAALTQRMAVVGLVSYAAPWITRLDVAVDADCHPAEGKLLLDALEATRLPNGWRTTSSGVPRSTVYFRARGTEKVYARAYCRNLKTKTGEPYGRIRLEVEKRFEQKACRVERLSDPDFAGEIWRGRYAAVSSTVTRLPREVQVVEIADRVQTGELTYAQGERLSMFLDLERLGLAQRYYPKSVFAARKREARRFGYSTSDTGAESLTVELAELLQPYVNTVEAGGAAVSRL
jgi:hypothetical protein